MTALETILAARDSGTLLESLAATPYDHVDFVADALTEAHNRGDIDFLAACDTHSLQKINVHSFFSLQHLFCRALPTINCSAEQAATACRRMFERASPDMAAGLVYDALLDWFRKSPHRTEEGLALIRRDPSSHTHLIRPVLLAGPTHDNTTYIDEAFVLSYDPQSHIRIDALWTLARILPPDHKCKLQRLTSLLIETAKATVPAEEIAAAVDATIHLLWRCGSTISHAAEEIISTVSNSPSPEINHALASGLLSKREAFTETMIDAAFLSLQSTDRNATPVLDEIDSILYIWDLDKDRRRVLKFLSSLLGHRDNAPKISDLKNFAHNLENSHGELLGWYVVSLLLTGDYNLCEAAARLLPSRQAQKELSIDLDEFLLTPNWILFLARKLVSYCLMTKEATAALLLSCLRATPPQNCLEIEQIIFDYFLMNYLDAIDWMDAAVPSTDVARESVDRLSTRVRLYIEDLDRLGKCTAFIPSERERQIQAYRRADFFRNVRKKAETASVFATIAQKSTILYGTSSIVYVYRVPGSEPDRQELSMTTHETYVELPRLNVLDPVGLQYSIRRFQAEPPPS